MNKQAGVSLDDWLERWEQEYADGQTTISRAEAVRRWEQEVGSNLREARDGELAVEVYESDRQATEGDM